jgi:uncharacterized protein (TIGR03382 family)
MSLRLLSILLILSAAHALAQDASVPDASVGMGGSEQNNQEMGDGTENTVCSNNSDCERGFSCNTGRCHYSGTKTATCQGCGGGAMAAFIFPAALLLLRRRRG